MKLPGKMLFEAFKSLFEKADTVKYPDEKLTIPQNLRGKLKFNKDLCVCCGLCAKDCPSEACKMILNEDGKKRPVFDIDFCTFCAQCVESCPRKAITMTSEYELAHFKKGELIVR